MSALSIQPTYPIFTDIDGQPLEDGFVWVGTTNLDPQTNPIAVYWDAALTLPAVQPIRTLAGYPSNSGTPARLYVNSDYSIRVMNKKGSAVYSAPTATERYSSVVVGGTSAANVTYMPAGTGAVESDVQTELRREVWVENFLPDGFDYAADDAQPYIQAAINTGAGEINLDDKTYLTDSPIYLDGGQALIGRGMDKTIIKKRTTTAGTGSNTARGGAVTDSYAKNAILICRHGDNGYNYRTRLEDLSFYSDGYIVDYGIYAPRMSQLYMSKVNVFQCRIGLLANDAWLSTIVACIFNCNTLRGPSGGNYGWPDANPSYGVLWQDDGSGSATGTSAAFIDCWARDCHYGWWLYGLQYSSMNSCASDNISLQAYRFHLCKMTINGSACENVIAKSSAAWSFEGGFYVLNGCQAQAVTGGSAGTTAMLSLTGGAFVFNSCQFEDFTTPNTSFNIIVQSNATITKNNTSFPTNGNTFVGYGSGSQIIDLNGDDPYIISESAGRVPRYWRSRARDNEVLEKTNKAVVSAGTVIATLTSAGGSFDKGVCEFTVSWSDLPFPTAVGIAKFMVSVMKEGANYRSAVSAITSAYASNGGAGVPTFALSLVGNVWSLTMTPLDGDLTVHTITAEMQNITGITLALP